MVSPSLHNDHSPLQILTLSYFLILLLFMSIPKTALSASSNISVMAYNVENLFDATDDGVWQGDATYLPMRLKKRWKVNKCASKEGYRRYLCDTLDWHQGKYETRLARVARVLLGYDRGGADIIVLSELENKNVIVDLWKKHLRKRGYLYPIHFESPSRRGIDVGIMSRYPLAQRAIPHYVDLKPVDPTPTRFIVEATFRIENDLKLRVTANHWPSLAHDVMTRVKAASIVKKIAVRSRREGIPFIAIGDFNTLPSEVPNPIENNLADNNLRTVRRPMVDMQDYLGGYPNFDHDGSHFYKGVWSPLDRILVSKDLFRKKKGRSKTLFYRRDQQVYRDASGSSQMQLRINLRSFGVYAPSYLLTEDYIEDPETGDEVLAKFPLRMNFLSMRGYSDHLPVVVKLIIN